MNTLLYFDPQSPVKVVEEVEGRLRNKCERVLQWYGEQQGQGE